MAATDYCTTTELKAYIQDFEQCTFTAAAGTDKLTLSDVVYAKHLQTGAEVEVSSTDTLPDPLAANTVYYVILDADQLIQLATSSANATAGTNIDLTDAGTGTHTIASAAADDDLLEDIIAAAVDYIETETGRSFVATSDTRYYGDEALDGLFVWLDEDLYSLTSVANGDSSGTAIDTDDITLWPRNLGPPYYRLRLDANSSSTWELDTDYWIAITATWGFSSTPPDQIKLATRILAKFLYDQRRTDRWETIVTPGGGTISIPQGIPRTAQLIIDRYRKVLI